MRQHSSRVMAGALVVVGAVALAGAPARAASPAPDAASVRPLLVGASVPAVSVRDPAGQAVDLQALTSKQRTVLIFYRGGW